MRYFILDTMLVGHLSRKVVARAALRQRNNDLIESVDAIHQVQIALLQLNRIRPIQQIHYLMLCLIE
jgi:hypothetical protein